MFNLAVLFALNPAFSVPKTDSFQIVSLPWSRSLP